VFWEVTTPAFSVEAAVFDMGLWVAEVPFF
jgi:hypothetical protein